MADPDPVVGARYLVTEDEYRFGLGPLLVEVTLVIGPVEFGAAGRVEVWWHVEAVCRVPGQTGPGLPRTLYLRADRLRSARRR